MTVNAHARPLSARLTPLLRGLLVLALLPTACGDPAGEAPPGTRLTVRQGGAAGVGPSGVAGSEKQRGKGDGPMNIIMISLDTVRADHMSLYGYERNTTPSLEQLAAKSLVFDRAYTTFSWTLVAHMSMLTGLYPRQHGVTDQHSALPESVPTLASRLKREGYHTMGFYDTRWLDARYGFQRGFDVYRRHYGAGGAGEHMTQAMAGRPKQKPFFLFLHLMDAHNKELNLPGCTMYEPPAPFDEVFDPEARQTLAGVDVEKAWSTSEDITPDQHEAIVALYDGAIRYLDTKLGEWIGAWWDAGLLKNTVIIITADHGEGLDQRGSGYGGHGSVYEEGLRVPLIVYVPGNVRAGQRMDTPVSHVDLVPTILHGLAKSPDKRLPGRSLLGPLDDRLILAEQPGRAEVFWDDPVKLIRPAVGERGTRIFRLDVDPREERHYILDDEEPEFFDMRREVRRREAKLTETLFQPAEANPDAGPLPADAEATLRALGYLGGRDEGGH